MSKNTTEKSYHYKACGLENIFLLNGYVVHPDEGSGESISFENIEGLHTAIGLHIVRHNRKLDGAELRFLRKEMEATQKMISHLLGVDEQTVANWEKEKVAISGPADRLIRLLYTEHINKNSHVLELLEKISQIEDMPEKECSFVKTTENGWCAAA